ncbi:MAG TPA: hypothetical protein VGM91_22815 [Conexibacter sp.]|jgi:hypothetical protein
MSARRAERRATPRRTTLPNRAVLIGGCVVIVLVLVLLVRGCGSDTLSAAELRSQSSLICARANGAIDRVTVPNAPTGGERFLAQGLIRLRPANARLRLLKAPDELRADYERAVTTNAREIDLITATGRAIAGGADVIDSYRALERSLAPLVNDENDAWQALRVPACERR